MPSTRAAVRPAAAAVAAVKALPPKRRRQKDVRGRADQGADVVVPAAVPAAVAQEAEVGGQEGLQVEALVAPLKRKSRPRSRPRSISAAQRNILANHRKAKQQSALEIRIARTAATVARAAISFHGRLMAQVVSDTFASFVIAKLRHDWALVFVKSFRTSVTHKGSSPSVGNFAMNIIKLKHRLSELEGLTFVARSRVLFAIKKHNIHPDAESFLDSCFKTTGGDEPVSIESLDDATKDVIKARDCIYTELDRLFDA
jgi:hypothetical protein